MINQHDIHDYVQLGLKQPQAKGDRFNTGKPKWSLIPQSALLPMVRQAEYGATKYAAWNWTKGLKVTEICESLKRHLDAFMEGKDLDEEGMPHIGGIQWNAMALQWMLVNKPELDDRYKHDNVK